MTYHEAVAYIKKSYNLVIRLGLSRMEVLLEKLGNPHNYLKFIHVAGTNGKGSVCAMTAQILQCAGFQTGLFTSPVIADYREQFQINLVGGGRVLAWIYIMNRLPKDAKVIDGGDWRKYRAAQNAD